MEKTCNLFFALSLLALCVGAYSAFLVQTEASAQEAQSNSSTYQNSLVGIKMLYPKDWRRVDNGANAGSNGTVVEFIGPGSAPAPSINVFVYHLAGGIPLRDLVTNALNQIETVHRNSTQAIHLKDNSTAYQTAYDISTAHTNFQKMQTFAIKNGSVYVVTYTAVPEKYGLYLPAAKQIINSTIISNVTGR